MLEWNLLSQEDKKFFLESNGVTMGDISRDELIRPAKTLYMRENIIITDKVFKLELERETGLIDIPIELLYQISYNMNRDEVLAFCATSQKFQNLCDAPIFWKFWLGERTGLGMSFFEEFDESDDKKKNIFTLVKNYSKYEDTGDFELLTDYMNLMTHLFTESFKEYKEISDMLLEKYDKYIWSFIKYGGLPYFNYLVDELKYYPDSDVLGYAIDLGDIELIKYLVEEYNLTPEEYDFAGIIGLNDIDLVKYFVGKFGPDLERDYLIDQNFPRSLELFKYLVETFNLNIDNWLLDGAAFVGSLDIVKYIIEEYKLIPDEETLESAAFVGSLEVVKYLINEHDLLPDNKLLGLSARSGNPELIKFFVEERGLILEEDGLKYAIISGNLELVKYLVSKFSPLHDNNNFRSAVKSGNMELFKYINSRGYTEHNFKYRIVNDAIGSGNPNIVKYLVDNSGIGYWGYRTVESEIKSMLKYSNVTFNFKMIEYILGPEFQIYVAEQDEIRRKENEEYEERKTRRGV